MSLDAIKRIRLAEDEADEIKRQAVNRAREIILAAEREGEDLIRNATREAQRNTRILYEKAELEAEQEIRIMHENFEKQKSLLFENSKNVMHKAVSLIFGKVVGLNGNR